MNPWQRHTLLNNSFTKKKKVNRNQNQNRFTHKWWMVRVQFHSYESIWNMHNFFFFLCKFYSHNSLNIGKKKHSSEWKRYIHEFSFEWNRELRNNNELFVSPFKNKINIDEPKTTCISHSVYLRFLCLSVISISCGYFIHSIIIKCWTLNHFFFDSLYHVLRFFFK